MRKQNRKQNRIKRAHGLDNHAPRGVVATHSIASPELIAHQRATIKERHFLDGEMLKLNGEIRRFETMRLVGGWLLAAAAAFVLVVCLSALFGIDDTGLAEVWRYWRVMGLRLF
jgi:hypothetical protein